jgi:hypothetical protein
MIKSVRSDDSGKYACFVSNLAGTAEKSFQIDVYGKKINCIIPNSLAGIIISLHKNVNKILLLRGTKCGQ